MTLTTTIDPKGFNDLDVAELRRTAIEDFACDIEANANKKTVMAALTEDGVSWDQYAKLKGLNVIKAEPTPPPTVLVAEVPVVEQEVEIITAQPINPTATQKYLIRMDRDNVRFDIRGYKFTKEHPYALVDAKDVDAIVDGEKGFRMARPSEVEDFYS